MPHIKRAKIRDFDLKMAGSMKPATTPEPAPGVTGKMLLGGLLAVALPALVLIVWAATTKHVWYDEMWSKWVTSHELGFADALRLRWLYDVHPPFFYAYNWLASTVTGPSVQTHRLINLIWLVPLAGVGGYIAVIRPAMRSVLTVGGLLLLSNNNIVYFAEYRAYALIFCASAALMILFSEMLQRDRDFSMREDRTLMLLIGANVILLLNLHYLTTLVCGMVLAVFTLDQMRLRRWRWAGIIIIAGTIGVILVASILWVQGQYLQGVTQNFWLNYNTSEASRIVLKQLIFTTGLNVVVLGCLGIEFMQFSRGYRLESSKLSPGWHFAVVCAVAIIATCLVLLTINFFKPVIFPRYLIALSPVAIMAMAMLTARHITARRWVFGLFVINALAVSAWFIKSIPDENGWDEAAGKIAAIVNACPETRVYTIWRLDALPKTKRVPPPNEVDFLTWAMADISATYGLKTRFIRRATNPQDVPPLSTAGCPTVLWAEQAGALDGVPTARALGLSDRATPAAAIRTIHTDSGTIILLTGPP